MRVDGSEEEESGQGSHQGPSDNPFTVPVAMLFYRVAKNMRASEDADSKIPTIRALLTNALSLLNNHQYPKVTLGNITLFMLLNTVGSRYITNMFKKV